MLPAEHRSVVARELVEGIGTFFPIIAATFVTSPLSSFITCSKISNNASAYQSGMLGAEQTLLGLFRRNIDAARRRNLARAYHHESRVTPATASKCSSRVRIGRSCWRAMAAIQTSFDGSGVPAFLNSCRITA